MTNFEKQVLETIKKYKLIGLDASTAITKKINVFTFEETSDFLK